MLRAASQNAESAAQTCGSGSLGDQCVGGVPNLPLFVAWQLLDGEMWDSQICNGMRYIGIVGGLCRNPIENNAAFDPAARRIAGLPAALPTAGFSACLAGMVRVALFLLMALLGGGWRGRRGSQTWSWLNPRPRSGWRRCRRKRPGRDGRVSRKSCTGWRSDSTRNRARRRRPGITSFAGPNCFGRRSTRQPPGGLRSFSKRGSRIPTYPGNSRLPNVRWQTLPRRSCGRT